MKQLTHDSPLAEKKKGKRERTDNCKILEGKNKNSFLYAIQYMNHEVICLKYKSNGKFESFVFYEHSLGKDLE